MRIQKIIDTYKDKAEFVLVYIREAHPEDGWAFKKNVKLKDPVNLDEREKAAKVCIDVLKLKCKTVIDDMKDSVNISYAAQPERLAVVGKDGKIAYMGKQGPWGFKPDELDEFLKKLFK